jgi:outer membrane protein TolC
MSALAICVAGTAQAQTQTEAQANGGTDILTLDLPKALEIALSTNPTIKTAEMEVERFDYVRKEAMGNHLPTLAVGGQFAFNIVKQEMAKGMSLGADMSAAATADLTIPLFAPAIYSTMKMSRMQQELAVEQARSSRITMVNSVKKAFYQILLLENSYAVLQASAQTIRETVENTRTMYGAGLASEYDLLTAEVQLSNLQPNLISVGNSIDIAKQMLKMYLSIPEHVAIAVSGSLDDHRDASFATLPSPSVDLSDNSEIRQLDYQQSLVRQQIKLANTGYMPTVAAYGTLMLTGQDKTPDFAGMMMGGTGTINKWWWQNPASAGIRVSIPIFTGLKEHYKVKQLRNSIAQIDLQKDYLREAKQLEASTAVNSLMSAREKVIANEKTVEQAEKAYSIARTRFDAGAGTMLEVNQAELNVTSARLNRSQAIYDFLAAQADYDKVIGVEN